MGDVLPGYDGGRGVQALNEDRQALREQPASVWIECGWSLRGGQSLGLAGGWAVQWDHGLWDTMTNHGTLPPADAPSLADGARQQEEYA